MIVTNFKARNMPVTLLRTSTKQPFTAPGWNRLQKHIEKHEKAGGWSCIKRHQLPEAIVVEGYLCVEMADVELFSPLA